MILYYGAFLLALGLAGPPAGASSPWRWLALVLTFLAGAALQFFLFKRPSCGEEY